MLSKLSCAHRLFIYLLWKNVHYSLLSTFKLGYFPYSLCDYLLFNGSSFNSSDSIFWCAKYYILFRWNWIYCVFICFSYFATYFQESITNFSIMKASPYVFWEVWGLTSCIYSFGPVFDFHLYIVWGNNLESEIIHHLLKWQPFIWTNEWS